VRNDVLGRLRTLCLALPETSERLSHGAPSFFVREKKCFLMLLDDHHGDGIFGIWCAAPPGNQELLVQADPARFFRPPYVGHRGWLGVCLNDGVDWDELAGSSRKRSRPSRRSGCPRRCTTTDGGRTRSCRLCDDPKRTLSASARRR
jgi:hypothetical protein